jgi:hypothetical protein
MAKQCGSCCSVRTVEDAIIQEQINQRTMTGAGSLKLQVG